MKLREIFRFELTCQARRLSTWLPFAALAVVALLFVRGNFLYADFFINSPFVIASTTVFCSLFWLVVAAGVTGEVAARDVETGMHPLTYTAPVSKAKYLGGRFLAAFALHALILLAVPVGVMLAVYSPGVDTGVIGPFRPAAYLTAYGFLALPNAFIGTSIQFAFAALGRRAVASYLGGVLLLLVAYGGFFAVIGFLQREDLEALFDVFGNRFLTDDLMLGWTPIEKNTRLVALHGVPLRSRLLWLGIGLGTLAFTYVRFRFEHLTASPWWSRLARRRDAHAPSPPGSDVARSAISVPQVRGTFGPALYARQTLAIAWDSFRVIAKSRGGLVLLAAIAAAAVVVLPEAMEYMGTPLLPRTEFVLTFLTARLTNPMTPWVIIPLLTAFYAGELVWREREAGLSEITDVAPVPEWVLVLGKFLGLGLVLVVWMALLTLVGVLVQLRLGYHEFEIGLYLQVLFGLQLPEYLLFALLALVVQGSVSQKYVGLVAALLAYASILFAARLGIEHRLLVYGSAPGWFYTDMRGFGPSLGPWRWFMLYWAAWALLLAVVARLLWVRGMERGLRVRLRLARGRFTRPTARAAAAAAGLVLTLGGFIFYNTNVLNEYRTASQVRERRAEYERRYARYADVPQPRLAAANLHVEIHPDQRKADIRGTYRLVNRGAMPIDSIHLATAPGVETGAVAFDRPAARVLADEELGHGIYALETPLQPGDSLRLHFEVRFAPRGFRSSGIDASVVANGTYFTNHDWLPAIGYQPRRELRNAGDWRAHGLAPRRQVPTPADAEAVQDVTGEAGTSGAERIAFEAVVGTEGDQTAVAPGTLRRTWTEGGRRYFHFATDAPIGNEYAFFSARYAVHEERWTPPAGSGQPVAIQVYHHPQHAANLDRMLLSVRASLDSYTRAFGPYPHGHVIRLVEKPGPGMGAHAEAATIDYAEGFTRLDPADDPRGLDLPFAVMAHEMAHQWGVPYAFAEGAPLLSESFAWYAAMGVVEETYGREHLQRLRRFFRQPSPIPPIRQTVPLLRAMDPYAAYRRGPAALFAMSEYMGEERVNLAFRRLIEKHRSGAPPLATSLDLYRELQAVTPDSLRHLLHDLFAANTVWDLRTERATARQTAAGSWLVTLRVRARKVTVDPAGVETEVPMNEWVQVGVFAPTQQGAEFGETLYLRKHRIRSGEQTITVTVPRKPSDAGIDPYHLLIELERFDNVEEVEVER
ncbi:MAG TPA: ABC transporter permease [Longimicrobiaceae bacterium]|nr:ABC transporter permease [Longimicrobiaceae bacterium]